MNAPTYPAENTLSECSHFTHQFARQRVIACVTVLVQWLSETEGDAPLAHAQELLEQARDARDAADRQFDLHQANQRGEPYVGPATDA